MKQPVFFALLAVISLWSCQNQVYPLRDSPPHAWEMPLRSDSASCVGFGPYAWGKHVWVQVDSQAVGLRHGFTGQLLWSVSLPKHWLNDAWVLEEVAIQEDALWMFEDSLALRIDPYSGQTSSFPYPLVPGTWTTRMAHPLDSTFLLPIYDAQGISVWSCDATGNWTQLARHTLASQQYAVLDGWVDWAGGWAATLRTWDAASQSGQVVLWVYDPDSLRSYPIAEDPGNGLPILYAEGLLYIGTAEKVLAWSLSNQALKWAYTLPFAWNIPGFTWDAGQLLVVNHMGEVLYLDSASGALVQQFQLPGISWMDRIRPGALGAYVQWDRGILQLRAQGWRKSYSQSTQTHHVLAVLSHSVVARDDRFVFSVSP
jgi:hypothetical protein